MAAHCAAMVGFLDAGAEVFDYGNSLRAEAQLGGFERAFDYPGFVPAYIRPLFCEGKGPFRWVALSGDPADIAATDRAVLEEFPDDEALRALDPPGRRADRLPGPAGADLLARLRRAPPPRPALQRAGALRRGLGADRDRPRPPRLRLGRLALPRDRGDGRRLRRRSPTGRCSTRWSTPPPARPGSASTTAAASASGARSTPAWSASPTAPTSRREKLERVLTSDPGMGVIRHADAGYERAVEVAARARRPASRCARTASDASARSSPIGRPGAARARPRAEPPTSSRSPEIQRLIDDMIETMRAANGAGLAANQVGEAVRDRGRRGRGRQPPLPVQAADPAHGGGQPGDRAARRRAGRDQRGLPLGARPARRVSSATSTSGSATSTATASEHDEVKRGLTAGTFQHESTTSTASSSSTGRRPATLATWEQFERYQRDEFVERITGSSSESGREPGPASTLWCELAWLGGERAEAGVLVELDGDRIGAVEPRRRRAAAAGDDGSRGLTIPGLANAHSHAFHRRCAAAPRPSAGDVLDLARADVRGRRADSTPDSLPALARRPSREMALAGITAVGEFHYLHHGPGGAPLRRPERDGTGGRSTPRGEAGIRITLLDTCYLHGGIGQRARAASSGASRDGNADAWAERVERLERRRPARAARRGDPLRPRGRPGVGGPVAAWAARARPGRSTPTSPSSRPRTRTAGPRYGVHARPRCSPTPAPLGERFTAVHATHLDRRRLRAARRRAVRRAASARPPSATSPTASGRRAALADAGARLCARHRLARRDRPFEEARAVELDERLATGERGTPRRRRAARAATADGYAQHRLARGRPDRAGRARRPGDRRPRRACAWRARRRSTRSSPWSSRRSAADVRDVMVGGRVRGPRRGASSALDVAAELGEAIAQCWPSMSSLAIDDIGLLVTNDPALGEGPLGIVRDAALVVRGRPGGRGRARRARRPTSASTPAAAA